MPQPPLSAAKRSRVVELLRAGELTRVQIAKRVGCGEGTVSKIAADEGLSGVRRRKNADGKRAKVHAEIKNGGTFEEVGRRAGVDESTARRYAGQPATDPVPALECPTPTERRYAPFEITRPGKWLVIGDIHVPYHDRRTVELAVGLAKRDGCVGVLLNGDTLDSHEISSHDKDPSAPRYVEEVATANALLAWLRAEMPKVDIVFKFGNHDDRLHKYIYTRAPALFDLPFATLPHMLDFAGRGIEYVTDKRVIKLGHLHVVHGHEYQGGGGVNPARWLYLRARSSAMTSHFHRTSEHHERNIAQKYEAAWSIGCACHLSPAYAPLTNWNLGFAIVEVASDLSFSVRNLRVMDGKVF